jgi:hypothetical protein
VGASHTLARVMYATKFFEKNLLDANAKLPLKT